MSQRLPRSLWLPLILATAFIAFVQLGSVGTPAGAGSPRTGLAATMAPVLTPSPTPSAVAVSQLGPTPPSVVSSPVSFTYSRHYYRPGDMVTASIHINTAECRIISCYVGAPWTTAGAPAGRCSPHGARCSWPLLAATPLYQWQSASMAITTTQGTIRSSDFYAVLPRSQSVLETRVSTVADLPYAGLMIRVNGPVSATLTSDSNGFAIGLLPSGSYRLRLDAGTPAADHWFQPLTQVLSVQGVATAHVVGYNHLQMVVGSRTVVADGTQAVTVTVHSLNPFGQPVAGLGVRAQVFGRETVLCSLTPNQRGYVEPQDVLHGVSRYVPVDETADGTGTLSYQAYFGTEPGVWRLSVHESSLSTHDPWFQRLTVGATVSIKPAHWAPSFPAHFVVRHYEAGMQGATSVVSLSQALWYALHGKTVPAARAQAVVIGPLNVGDVSGSQRAVLRWLNYYAPLTGLDIGPVFAGGANNWGVAIFVHHHFGQQGVTRVLDTTTLTAVLTAVKPTQLPALPTLGTWAVRTRSPVVQGYGASVVEAGRTYFGRPYLPRTDLDFTTFEANCGQRAPSP